MQRWLRRLRIRRGSDGQRGATAVELALIMPFVAALLVGAIDVGLMFNTSQELESAARDAARLASEDVDATKSEIEARVIDALGGSTAAAIVITPDIDMPCDGRGGDPVSVNVQITDQLNLLFVAAVDIDIDGFASFACTTDQ